MSEIETIIQDFSPITLKDMDGVRLLNRKDTKFVFSRNSLATVLQQLVGHYRILSVGGVLRSEYQTRYFDTDNHDFYLQHHNGWTDRYKVRFRTYLDSGDCFLEVKHKVKGRTKKYRRLTGQMEEMLSDESLQFVTKKLGYTPELHWTISNNFNRITLVNKSSNERVTLDTDITFIRQGATTTLDHIVIAEVKQESHSRDSRLMKVLKDLHIRPMKISKYCVGSIYMYDDIKYNRFKGKLLTIQRLKHDIAS